MKHCLAVLVVSFIYLTFVQGICLTLSGSVDICQYFSGGGNKYFTFTKDEYWTCKDNSTTYGSCDAPTLFFNPVTGQCQTDDPNSFVYNKETIADQCKKHKGIIEIGNNAGIFAHCFGDAIQIYNVLPGLCYDPENGPCKAITGNKE